ncbi:MAG: hypothetical protein Q8Q65_00595 [bacterium]|nr:hypothetical protein [bacterium]
MVKAPTKKNNRVLTEARVRRIVKEEIRHLATKDDLKNFATKDDIKNMATKDDLKNFATKDDIRRLDNKIWMTELTFDQKLDDKFRHYMDMILRSQDKVVKELADMRDEFDTMVGYRDQLEDHENRIESLESRVLIQ